jgi:hypothetical protein
MSRLKGAVDLGIALPVVPAGTLNYRGAWAAGTSYLTNDVVSRSYGLFVALQAQTSQDPLGFVETSAQPLLVQKTSGSPQATWPAATKAGNFLVAVVTNSNNGTATTITMPAGWISAGIGLTISNDYTQQIFYYPNAPIQSGIVSPSATTGGLNITIAEFGGFPSESPTVQFDSTYLGSVGTSISLTASAPTTAQSLTLVHWLTFNTANTIISETGAFTPLATIASNGVAEDTRYSHGASAGQTPGTTVTDSASTYQALQIVSFNFPSTVPWAQLAGFSSVRSVTKTATYAMAEIDTVLLTNGTFTVTLPPIDSFSQGQRYTVKNTGTGTITIVPASGTIDGAANVTLTVQYSSFDFVSDGTNWFTV